MAVNLADESRRYAEIGESRENDGLMDVRCDSEEQNIK